MAHRRSARRSSTTRSRRRKTSSARSTKAGRVGKRLLQHERSGMSTLRWRRVHATRARALSEVAKTYVGQVATAESRRARCATEVIRHAMNSRVFRLTQRRTVEESQRRRARRAPRHRSSRCTAPSCSRNARHCSSSCAASTASAGAAKRSTPESSKALRNFLGERAASIYSGSNEIQRNIIAKRVLGLPIDRDVGRSRAA